MRTAGNLIRETRLKNNLSKSQLGEMTHIKTSFIEAIENSDWDKLPEPSVVIGFVKSISHFLDIDEGHVLALLRREYNPIPKNEKQKSKNKEINKKFIWGPKFTFLALIVIILVIILGYLGFQYKKFNSPPKLTINEPVQNQIVKDKVTVNGQTDPDTTIEINNQPVIVESDGTFTAQIEVSSETKELKIIAKSRSGKETIISRTIEVKP